MLWLAVLFAGIATLYSSLGFGGGSSYLALLILWDIPYQTVPVLALICNIVVVAGSSWHYVRAGFLNHSMLIWLVIGSIPLAYLGGRIELEKQTFLLILMLGLIATGIRLLIIAFTHQNDTHPSRPLSPPLAVITGGVLGGMAGITGIGGGIFLSPILYNLRAGSSREISTLTSMFILLNSVSGLIGQLQKLSFAPVLTEYYLLPLAAFIGGQTGAWLMLKKLSPRWAAVFTAILVLGVSAQIGVRLWGDVK